MNTPRSGLFCFVAAFSCSVVQLLAVTLEWNPNTEADLAGYKLHWGPVSGAPSMHRTLATFTTATVDDAELPIGEPIYFTVTAFDLAGLESLPSNEVVYTRLPVVVVPPTPTLTPAPTPSITPSSPESLRFKLTITSTREFPYASMVLVVAPSDPPGFRFDHWKGDKVILSNFLSRETSALIPPMDVQIEAVYVEE